MGIPAVRPATPGRTAATPRSFDPTTLSAAAAGVLAVVASLVALVTLTTADAWSLPAAREVPVDAAIGISYTSAAVLVLAGSGGRWMGLLLLGIGLSGGAAAVAATGAALATEPSVAASIAVLLQSSLWVPGFVPLLTLVPLLYPDGRLPGRAWRVVVAGALVGMALLATGSALYPDAFSGRTVLEKPVTDESVAKAATLAAAVVLLPTCLASLSVLVRRFRSAEGLVRRQVAVLLVAAVVLVADTALQGVLPWPVDSLSQSVAVALLPAAIAVAVTRHRLYDLDLAVCRAIAALSLGVCLAAAYVTLFSIADHLFPGRTTLGAAVSAAAVGVLVHPLGVRLHRGVDRLFYGDRAAPAAVLGRVSSGLRQGLDLGEVPAHVCRALVDGLRLTYAGLVLGPDASRPVVSQAGEPAAPAAVETVALDHRGETVAVLLVGPRQGETRLDTRDRELLAMVGDQVAPALAALRLSESLQHSRAALVGGREEERRRLRRELHDGVGAALAGLRLQVESARDLVTEPTAGALLDSAVRGVSGAIEDLRSVTEGLRPPALDDLGLPDSLRGLARRMSTPSREVRARVELTGRLPAAVEVACYRIAAEALANAVRHSGSAEVRLTVVEDGADVRIEVADDGVGLPTRPRPGALGLDSMRQRAEEIGGELSLSSGAAGTTVRVRIPKEVG